MSRPLSYNVYAKEAAGDFGLRQLESGLELPKTQSNFFSKLIRSKVQI